MTAVSVAAASAVYNVYAGRQIDIASLLPSGRCIIIADTNALRYWEDRLGGLGEVIAVEGGESAKSPEGYLKLTDRLLSMNITRSDILAAFGGGTVGDLTGFAAATLLRGIRLVMIPTTLLAMADSSVGGKNGINTRHGKNLLGTFLQPEAVICDADFLSTLPLRQYANGMGEMLKYEYIAPMNGEYHCIEEQIAAAVRIKADIVAADEREAGLRRILNLGHTLGHVLEKCSADYNHGEAVAVGMYYMALIGEEIGITGRGTAAEIAAAAKKYSLPSVIRPLPASAAFEYLHKDKKADNKGIDCVFPVSRGHSLIKYMSFEDLEYMMRKTEFIL